MGKISNSNLHRRLEAAYIEYNDASLLDERHPDPLIVARRYRDEKIALLCALFGYGSAKQIVRFLEGLDFSLLEADDATILRQKSYYRFQNPTDVAQIFITLKRAGSLYERFVRGYAKNRNILDGLSILISYLRSLNDYRSYGYDFLLGRVPKQAAGGSPLKRWMMYLRWMVRKDNIDMGLWSDVSPADLIIPLDTHTFRVARKLGLLRRKSYDLKAAMELTEALRRFDPVDPVKYDFALYRLGQFNEV